MPVVAGAILKERSHTVLLHITVAMITATALSITYNGVLSLHAHEINVVPAGWYTVIEKIDTSVFGVAVSVVVFAVMRVLVKPIE